MKHERGQTLLEAALTNLFIVLLVITAAAILIAALGFSPAKGGAINSQAGRDSEHGWLWRVVPN